ncbi:hypothetical protein SAMN04515671_1473 [Nakamurella panacisegetis]|uniref:Peptidase n=1 Tax=Nakamurella panacisegetis TaxID=1090615 RepID=A0A1H0KYH4_9ACTN|nr:hypothetical protein [Nakamurella panacisegetis]SDO60822.1 hypothetical protein SAMN04515671_1473 [Nakamurella panacisegetis]
MRKFLALLLLVASIVLLSPGANASAEAPGPQGVLKSVEVNDFSNLAVMTGWALDPTVRSKVSTVGVSIDGHRVRSWQPASIRGHNFSISMTIPVGRHLVCVDAAKYRDTSRTSSLGCFEFQAYAAATKAQMLAIAKKIDPKNSVHWVWTTLPVGVSGQARPWQARIDIASGNSVRYLRAVMLHEWSHVLQYRAFPGADPWGDAIEAFNARLGDPGDRTSYSGVEHGADCIALALGADYLGYGCPAALRSFGSRIAHGLVVHTQA